MCCLSRDDGCGRGLGRRGQNQTIVEMLASTLFDKRKFKKTLGDIKIKQPKRAQLEVKS